MRKRNIIADSAPVAKSGHAPPDAAPFRGVAAQKGPGFSADSRDARATFTTSVWGGFYNLWPARAQGQSSFPDPRSPLLTGAASAVVDGRTLGVDMVPHAGAAWHGARGDGFCPIREKTGSTRPPRIPQGTERPGRQRRRAFQACLRLADGKNALCRACGRKTTAGLRLRRATACSAR